MQSGEDDYYTVDMLASIISNLKKMDIAVTLSLGEKLLKNIRLTRKLEQIDI